MFYKAVLSGKSHFASYVSFWKVTKQINARGLNKVEVVDFGVIASALNALEIHEANLLLGGYDAPKVIESVLRIVRSKYDQHQLFLRLDIDVEPDNSALQRLWQYHQEVRKGTKRYLFSGVYGSPSSTTRDLLNDYPVRINALIPPNGVDKTDSERLEKLETDVRNFFNILKKHGVDPLHQLISGAGFYMHPEIARQYPPFSNFQSLVTWIDDEIKAELVCVFASNAKEVVSDARFHQVRDIDGEKHEWERESGFDLSDTGKRRILLAWQKEQYDYLDRLVRGCLMYGIIKNEKFQAAVQSARAMSKVEYFGQISGELRSQCYQNVQRLLLDFSNFHSEFNSPIHYFDRSYSLLNIYPFFCDVEDIIEALLKDCETYITLVSLWNSRSETVAEAVINQLAAQNKQNPYESE